MFLGAGASRAAGFPLTEQLLQHIWPRPGENLDSWETVKSRQAWKSTLSRAVKVIYPDGGADGFRPPVSEFFTLLEVIDRVHAERERLPLDSRQVLIDLRREIAAGLSRLAADTRRSVGTTPHYRWIKAKNRPQVVITSNWDTLAEIAALKAGLSVYLRWPHNRQGTRRRLESQELVVLKLHGSIDWGLGSDPLVDAALKGWKYERLDAAILPAAPRRRTSRIGGEDVLRYRSVDAPVAADRSRVGFSEPLMATMSAAKDGFIQENVSAIWHDAYWALSRAKALAVVGYSFPREDLEISTLLRLTSRRAGKDRLDPDLTFTVCNPSPETHARARVLLGSSLTPSYLAAEAWTP